MLYSPNCLVALNVTSEAMRLDWGKAYRKAVNYSIVVTLVCVLQIALLFRQLYYSRTQAAASRVSLLTIGQQVRPAAHSHSMLTFRAKVDCHFSRTWTVV